MIQMFIYFKNLNFDITRSLEIFCFHTILKDMLKNKIRKVGNMGENVYDVIR